MENKNKILSYVGMGSGALMILSVFLPYISAYDVTKSLWTAESGGRVLFILLGLAVAALYVFNKKTELTYAAAGYGFFFSLEKMISVEKFGYLSISFYLLLLTSIAMFVVALMYDESKGVALFNLNFSANKNAFPQPAQQAMQVPVGQPMAQPVAMPVQQPVEQPIAQPQAPTQPVQQPTEQNTNQNM